MRAKEFEIKKRDPNWRAMQDIRRSGAGGQHKDKKKAEKQGYEKHKGKDVAEDKAGWSDNSGTVKKYEPTKKGPMPSWRLNPDGTATDKNTGITYNRDGSVAKKEEGIGGTIAGGVGQFFGNKIDPLHGEIMRAHGELAGRKAEYTIRKYMHLLQKALKQQLDSEEKTEDVEEASDFGEPREILEDVLQTLEREVEWPLTDVMDPREVKQLLAPIVKAVNDKMMSMEEGRRDYGYDDFGNSLRPGSDEGSTEPPNNFAIYINDKKWKVFQGKGQYADDQYEMQQFRQLQAMAARKSQETGKKWEVYRTGEPATK
jgi:hypothetical protein